MMTYVVTERELRPFSESLRRRQKAGDRYPYQLLTYERLLQASSLPKMSYIFAQVDLLPADTASKAAAVWDILHASVGPGCHLLNHPTRSMRRYELLRYLYEQGINRFDVYRLTEHRKPKSFPVFIRQEDTHSDVTLKLIHSQAKLDETISVILNSGHFRDDKIVIEFHDTADDQGLYRKYAAFVVGRRIVPAHMLVSKEWNVGPIAMGMTPGMIRDEREFLRENRFHDQLLEVCALARIEYGRIDFGVDKDGRLAIWEINFHPSLPRIRGRDLLDALYAVDSGCAGDASVKLRRPIVYVCDRAVRSTARGMIRVCPGKFRDRLKSALHRLSRKILDTRLGSGLRSVARHQRWIRLGKNTSEPKFRT